MTHHTAPQHTAPSDTAPQHTAPRHVAPTAQAWESAHDIEPGDLIGLDFSDCLPDIDW